MIKLRKRFVPAPWKGRAARAGDWLVSWKSLHYAVTAGLAVAVTATGWQLVQALRLSDAGLSSNAVATSNPALPPATAPPKAAAIATAIESQHWFGQASPKPAALPKAQVKTDGPVKVRGIIFSADKTMARAILALGDDEKSYRVGQILKNGDKVAAIQPGRVVLTHGGTRYALVLNHPKSAMLAEAPHFDGGNGAADELAVAANRSMSPAPARPPPTVRGASTLQRLQGLRARLLSGQ